MIGWTLCSGIGAPEVAAPWVDWRLASEIEKFPREVLQARHGYKIPADHNQGDPLLWSDMTEVTPELARAHGVPLPDLIVAGTPCQAFSVAGLRKGTADPRGNLTLSFVRICHAIVDARPDGKPTVLWENVPGVLSDKGNAFGAFLGGLVGAMDALDCPTGGSWPSEGMVEGPRARAAWSVLDAQWFGFAQRRERVFVVVDFGGRVDPAAILLEPQSLRGGSAPRREAGQGFAADIAPSLTSSGRGIERHGETRGQDPLIAFRMTAIGEYTEGDTASTLKQRDHKDATDLIVAHTLRAEGHDASEDGTGRGVPLVPVAYRTTGNDGVFETGDTTSALKTGSDQNAIMIATELAVRRLTPRECERLQGFPDDFTLIPRKSRRHFKAESDEIADYIAAFPHVDPATAKDAIIARKWADELAYLRPSIPDLTFEQAQHLAQDGPRYKALGNSMAVPVIKWIVDRIGHFYGTGPLLETQP